MIDPDDTLLGAALAEAHIDPIAQLTRLGYLPAPPLGLVGPVLSAPSPDVLETAVENYAAFHGVESKMATISEHMLLPRCGRPDQENANVLSAKSARLGQWPPGYRIKVKLEGLRFPGLTAKQTLDTWLAAIESWCEVCGVLWDTKFTGRGNIEAAIKKIDGQYGTLAYSDMPQTLLDPRSMMSQVYDVMEDWKKLLFMQATVCHEVGHAIGLDHIRGTGTAIMNPTISTILKPNRVDAVPAIARYGEALKPLPPDPDPDSPAIPPIPGEPLPPLPTARKQYFDPGTNVVMAGTIDGELVTVQCVASEERE